MKKGLVIAVIIASFLVYFALRTAKVSIQSSDRIAFQKTIGGEGPDRGISIQQTSDGGYIATGVTQNFDSGSEDVYLVRTNSRGDVLWTQTFGGEKKDNGWAVLQTEDGGFQVAGFSESFGSGSMDFYVIRTDSKGNPIWSKTYGGHGDDYCWDMDIIPGRGYILVGETGAAGQYREGNKDFYCIRIDEDGNVLWERTYGGPETDRGFSVQTAQDGGFVMVGSTTSFGAGGIDAYLVKTNREGEAEWTKTFGTELFDMGHDVRQRQDGGYVVFGYTESYGAKKRDTWFIGVNSEGKEEWSRIVGGPQADQATRGILIDNGASVLLGYTQSYGAGNWDVFLVKVSSVGNTVWTRTFGGPLPDSGYGIAKTADGGFILTGQTWRKGREDSDLLLIKTDSNGQVHSDSEN